MKHVVVVALIAACGGGAQWPVSDLEPSPPADPARVEEAVAARSNESGIEAMRAGRYAQASVHFLDATARSTAPQYLFNACLSLYREGKLGEARIYCRTVAANRAVQPLAGKARTAIERIEADAKAQGVPLLDMNSADDEAGRDQAAIAAGLSEEGVQLMFAQKYADASSRFREAVARSPEAKYFFNLCTSLFQEGKLADALVACDGVDKTDPTPELAGKAAALRERIHAEANAQNIAVATPSTPPSTTPPATGSQAAIAAKLDEEGKKLVHAKKYADASAKFRDAVARVPEPTYFFNLCTSLFQEGKFAEALTACAGGKRNQPTAALAAKLDHMIQRIRDEARAQNIPLEIH